MRTRPRCAPRCRGCARACWGCAPRPAAATGWGWPRPATFGRRGRSGGGIGMIFAQQSIREMTRTGRSPDDVMDDATWGIFQEGWRAGVGADADHLKTTADIDLCAAAGYTFFTIDPGAHVDPAADTDDEAAIRAKYAGLPWPDLATTAHDLEVAYVGKRIEVEDRDFALDEPTLLRAAVKYGRAVAHVACALSPSRFDLPGWRFRAGGVRRRNGHPHQPRRAPVHRARAAPAGRALGQPGPALRRQLREGGRLHRAGRSHGPKRGPRTPSPRTLPAMRPSPGRWGRTSSACTPAPTSSASTASRPNWRAGWST